jgi:hypothetical protein
MHEIALNLRAHTVILHALALEYLSSRVVPCQYGASTVFCQATCIFVTVIEAGYRVSLVWLSHLLSICYTQKPKNSKYRRPSHTPLPYMSLTSLTTCFSAGLKKFSFLFALKFLGRERHISKQRRTHPRMPSS